VRDSGGDETVQGGAGGRDFAAFAILEHFRNYREFSIEGDVGLFFREKAS